MYDSKNGRQLSSFRVMGKPGDDFYISNVVCWSLGGKGTIMLSAAIYGDIMLVHNEIMMRYSLNKHDNL